MALSRLLIRNVRNIASADLSLAADFNFLVGANGSGKTSVLEAIYCLAMAARFAVCNPGGSFAMSSWNSCCTSALTLNRWMRTRPRWGLSRNRLGNSTGRIDGSDGHKVTELAQLLPMQLITPKGFTLLNGGPKYRRAFMDWGCFHNKPGFFTAWSNQELIPLANRIRQWRTDYSEAIAADITATCAQFLPDYRLDFSFQRGWDKESDFGELLERQFKRDRALTYTASDSHKANFRIRVEGVPVEDILSRGQLKLLMCALRLAQGEFLTHRNGRRCLFDDFASELDTRRRRLLAERLKATHAQVFVSADQIRDITDEKGKMFKVEQGKISLQSEV